MHFPYIQAVFFTPGNFTYITNNWTESESNICKMLNSDPLISINNGEYDLHI